MTSKQKVTQNGAAYASMHLRVKYYWHVTDQHITFVLTNTTAAANNHSSIDLHDKNELAIVRANIFNLNSEALAFTFLTTQQVEFD
jgi:hypothetical protein